jgi:F-type H+-transporting ATPase subunit delta
VEGYPLEDFSAEAVRNQIAEEQKIAAGGGSEQDIAEAKIALEVSMMPPDHQQFHGTS